MAKKYYAVRVGKVPGIYQTWDECKKNVHGFPAAEYKSFMSMEEAKAYMGREAVQEINGKTGSGNMEDVMPDNDYAGIKAWAVGEWKRNKKGTIEYYNYITSVRDSINIRFVKVRGHSGVEGNEEADRLAKRAVGLC